jgi:hypothetical protein
LLQRTWSLLEAGDIDGWNAFMEDWCEAIHKFGALPERREDESAFDAMLRVMGEKEQGK